MKSYHMYHVETINAESKLREAERQEGRAKGAGGAAEPVFGLRMEERHQRRNAARKMEKMREKVRTAATRDDEPIPRRFSRPLWLPSEEGQIFGEQSQDAESAQRVPADSGGHQRLRLRVLHTRPARHH